jgi:hypothetical protein
MSSRIARLLCDVHPIWLLAPLMVVPCMAAVDWGWIGGTTPRPAWALIALWAAFPSFPLFPKLAAWRVLPVSRTDRIRAQCWLYVGLPLVWSGVAMGLVVMVRAIGPGVRALDVAAALSVQLLAATALACALLFGRVARRSWRLRPLLSWLSIGLVVAVVGVSLLPLPGPAVLLPAGGAALVIVLLAYAFAERFGDLFDSSGRLARVLPEAKRRAGGGSARGWRALAPRMLGLAATGALCGLAGGFSYQVATGTLTGSRGASLPTTLVVLMSLFWLVGGTGVVRSVRALRLLPIGALGLTLALQAFILAIAGLVLAGIWAGGALAASDPAPLRVIACACIPVFSLRLPLDFRFGRALPMSLMLAPLILLPLARLAPEQAWPEALAGGLVLTVAIWIWTWWELTRGRGAYRPQPLPPRWREAA